METSSYAAKLEKKLVTEFKDMFYEKMGYYPIVLVKNRTQGDGGIPVMSLDALKSVFEPFLPFINERPISLDSKH